MSLLINVETTPEDLLDACQNDHFDDLLLDPGMTSDELVAFLALHTGRDYSGMLLELARRHPDWDRLDTDALLFIFADDPGSLSDIICTRTLDRVQLTALAKSESKMVSGHAQNGLVWMDIDDSAPDMIVTKLIPLLALDDPTESQYRYCALAAAHPKTPSQCLDIIANRGDTLAKVVNGRQDRKA